MADTAIATVTQGRALGTNVAAGQGTAIVHANTHVITPAAGCRIEDMVIIAWNTEGSTNTLSVLAGDNPPADAMGQGPLTITLAATTGAQVLPFLESARFLQDNGTIRIDVESGTTGFIKAIQLLRG